MFKPTNHHIIPRSRGGITNNKNLKTLSEGVHVGFHQVFNNLMPHEQFNRLLEISGKVFTQPFKDRIVELIEESHGYIYEKGLLVPRKK